MSSWHVVSELVGLPGIPLTAQGTRKLASREGWQGRRREGTKATEYHISSLPEETRKALLKQAVKAIAAQAPAAEQLPTPRTTKGKRAIWQRASAEGALTHRQTIIRDARLLVVNVLQRMQNQGMNQRTACIQLLTWAASGELDRNTLNALAMGNSKSRAVCAGTWSSATKASRPPKSRPARTCSAPPACCPVAPWSAGWKWPATAAPMA